MKSRLLLTLALLGLIGLSSSRVSAQDTPTSGKITIGTELNVGDRMNIMWTSVDDKNFPVNIKGAKPVEVEGKIAYEITKKPVILEGPILTFECTMSWVKTLEFENCIYLKSIICGTNKIDYLDLTGLSALEYVNASSSNINTVKLDGCTSLTKLVADGNVITSINLGAATKLREASLSVNHLSEIDLTGVSCEGLDLSSNNLSSVDLSKTKNLQSLSISSNPLTSVKLTGCTDLVDLRAKNTKLQEVDLSGLTALKYADFNNGEIAKITLKDNAELIDLDLGKNKLTSIDLSGCASSLENLMLNHNQLKEITLKDLSNIMLVNLRGNKLTKVTIDNSDWLGSLVLSDNLLTEIDLSSLKEGLSNLDLDGNQLTSLDLSGFSELYLVNAARNQISSVKLDGCDNLANVDLSYNKLSDLKLPNKSLKEVYVYGNQIRGNAMTALMESLVSKKTTTNALKTGGEDPSKPIPSDTTETKPKVAGQLFIVKTRDDAEQNLCLVKDVKIATDKGWAVYDMRDRSDYKGAQLCKITSKTEGKGGSIKINGKTELTDVYTDTKIKITVENEKGYALKSLVIKTKAGDTKDIFKDRYFYVQDAETEVLATFTDDICKVTLKRMGEGILKLDGDGLDLNGLPRGIELKVIAEPYDDHDWELGGLYTFITNDKGRQVKINIKGAMGFTLTQDTEVYAEFDPMDPNKAPTDTLVWNGTEWKPTGIMRPVVPTTVEAQLYPNPATDFVIISEAQPAAPVEIYTLAGALIRREATNAEGYAELSVADLPEGTYILLIGNDPRKLIIRR